MHRVKAAEPGGIMKAILEKYVGAEIGINCSRPFKIESAKLLALGDDYFSIIDHATDSVRE
jgi:hypothetical protein